MEPIKILEEFCALYLKTRDNYFRREFYIEFFRIKPRLTAAELAEADIYHQSMQ